MTRTFSPSCWHYSGRVALGLAKKTRAVPNFRVQIACLCYLFSEFLCFHLKKNSSQFLQWMSWITTLQRAPPKKATLVLSKVSIFHSVAYPQFASHTVLTKHKPRRAGCVLWWRPTNISRIMTSQTDWKGKRIWHWTLFYNHHQFCRLDRWLQGTLRHYCQTQERKEPNFLYNLEMFVLQN